MLRNQLVEVLDELKRLNTIGSKQEELFDIILYIAEILNGLKEEY